MERPPSIGIGRLLVPALRGDDVDATVLVHIPVAETVPGPLGGKLAYGPLGFRQGGSQPPASPTAAAWPVWAISTRWMRTLPR
jgi:hypothetical protein